MKKKKKAKIYYLPGKKRIMTILFLAIAIFLSFLFFKSNQFSLAYTGFIFFGLAFIYYLSDNLLHFTYLKIDNTGFEYRKLVKLYRFKWNEIDELQLAQFGNKNLIAFHDKTTSQNRVISDSYGTSPQDIFKELAKGNKN